MQYRRRRSLILALALVPGAVAPAVAQSAAGSARPATADVDTPRVVQMPRRRPIPAAADTPVAPSPGVIRRGVVVADTPVAPSPGVIRRGVVVADTPVAPSPGVIRRGVVVADTPDVTLPDALPAQGATVDTGAAPAPSPPVADSGAAAFRASTVDTLYLGFERVGPLFPSAMPPVPGEKALWLRPRLEDWTAAWAATARANLARRRPVLAFTRPDGREKAAPEAEEECCRFLPPMRRDTTRGKPGLLPGAVADYADIGMRVSGRGELGSAWTRYYPCDPTTPILCNPGLFPQLKPDIQFGVQVGGTISDRVHVNVDYDQRREFDAANNINVYYEGKQDEILQRLEVGDVSIQLPQSRYLTTGIPAGNFGFKATGQMGPLDFQAVFAQQRGDVNRREFRLNGGAGQSAGLVQDATVTLDDADYVQGQFFFLVNPDSLPGAPHLNALQLRSTDAPADVRPAPGTLVLYRDERISVQSQAQVGQLGYFLADATVPGTNVVHSGYFRRLVAGDDYIVHSSGLWIVLRVPLRTDEALAMGYVTASGQTVGSIDADQSTTKPTLRLLRGPSSMHQPGQPTWPYEMHDVYRVDASNGVDASTVGLTISLGQLSGGKTFTTTGGKQITYLKLMGLDELPAADQLDASQIYQPAAGGAGKVGGTFVILPTLRPFETPPPVPSAGLSAADAAAALGNDANPAIYENPDPVAREAAARFRLNLTYRVKVDGMVSTISLGALGIREGSEKVYVAGQQLVNGKDYTIDYDIGTVTLLNPQEVFGANPDAEIRATWEQKSAFQIAPTSIFGLNTRYKLGGRGELNFIGLYQSEKSVMARPQLGNEPSSIFLGGISGQVDLGGAALDRLLAATPLLHATGRSSVRLTGEAAVSSPNPNTRGAAYVDDFEGGDEVGISLTRQSWRLGSKPADISGALGVLPDVPDVTNAMGMVWQHDVLVDGVVTGGLEPNRIDSDFRLGNSSGSATETVMYLTVGGDSVPGHAIPQRRWRSITTVLSTTGRDMSRSEFLEFYAKPPPNDATASLVLDLGTVSEDAFYYDAQGNTGGSGANGPWGLGIFDQEADVSKHEIWGTAADANGLWDQPCKVASGASYPWGDPRANCTRGNGLVDTEDLNGDGVLDERDHEYFRYVVSLGPGSPYLVRDTSSTHTGYRLYRVPLRGLRATPVNNASDATWRFIRDLRLTVVDSVGGDVHHLELTRMRLVGSRWTKRDLAGLEGGLTGTDPIASDTAAFQVGPVSSLTTTGYVSPPGVTSASQDPTSQFALGAAQIINETSLRLAADALGPNTRAEAYYRYPQQPRSFLNYRQMRLWAVARQGSWGPAGDQRLLIKVGSDPLNYYVYQARLSPPRDGGPAQNDWMPEITIDFARWFALRAEAEQALLSAPQGTDPVAIWSRDSTYGIVLQDRARAPNLAAVREISFAVYNGGMGTQPTEVWIDDLRLSSGMTDPGFAGNVTLDVRAGDFMTLQGSVASQGALYHQLNQDASYQRTGDAALNATAQMGMIAPPSWDLEAPLTFSWARTSFAPQFLAGTDIPADQLVDLRTSGSRRMRVGISLRRRTPMANPWLGLLVDGVALRLGYTGSSNGTTTSLAKSSGVDAAFTYDRRPSAREFGVIPDFLRDALRAVFPKRVEDSDFFKRLSTARFRWTPDGLSFSTAYYNQRSDAFRYDQVLRLPTDTLPPTRSARMGLDNNARLSLHPFESLTASVSLSSTRDLLPADQASDQLRVQQAILGARGGIAGVNLGWESDHSLATQLDWRPTLASWLRPAFSYTARYHTGRNPSFLELVPVGADSSAFMLRQFQADRQVTRSLQLDPQGFVNALFGPGKTHRFVRGLAAIVEPLEVTSTAALGSQFDRTGVLPGTGYQLGLGALDAWRFINGDTATNANTRTGLRARTGVKLPLGTELTASYEDLKTSLLDLGGGERNDDNRTWPGLQLTWPRIPLPKWISGLVTQVGLSGGYQHTVRASAFGTLGLDTGGDVGTGGGSSAVSGFLGRGAGDETSVPIQASIGLFSTLSMSYNGTVTKGTASDPTGDMRKNGSTHTVSMSGFFKVPHSMRAKFPNPVQATLGLSQQGDHQCRIGADHGCTPYIDYITRRLNLSLDTQLDQFTLGFQMSYNSRKSNIGTLNGSSQFQLGIFGQFNITAGQLTGVAPGLGR